MSNSTLQIVAVVITATTLLACDRADKVATPAPAVVNEFIIKDTQLGTGAVAGQNSKVTVHFTGWLYDPQSDQQHGKQFDSSRADDYNPARPFTFYLGAHQVIPGWDQGIVGMKVGGKRILIVPAALAYGERGADRGKVPKNAALIFEIELLDVKS